MSDTKRAAHDTIRVAGDTSYGSMTTVAAEAHRLLHAITAAHHRGPTDTWTAARDRAAKAAGIEPSYAKRIWNRWQTMTDVSGSAYRALLCAYHAQCERNEKAAARYRQLAEDIHRGCETDPDGLGAGEGMAGLSARLAAPAPPSLP